MFAGTAAPGTSTTVTVSDDYAVEVWQGGAADGSPLLLLGATPAGRFQAAIADAAAQRLGAVGVSGGGPFALATAIRAPNRVTAVGILAGIGPWRQLNDDAHNPDRALCALADAGDLTSAYAASPLRSNLSTSGREPSRTTPSSPNTSPTHPGLPWLTASAKAAWAADLRDAYTSYDGYGRDNVSWAGPWDIDPAAVTTPTWLWYGGNDEVFAAVRP